MHVLLLGGGGREHAIAWKLAQSPKLKQLFVSPGNAGTAQIAQNIKLDLGNHKEIIIWCKKNRIDLVVAGLDNLLADGIVDSLTGAGILVFGPVKAAAEIEWSKVFAKSFMEKEGIPTARFKVFNDADKAKKYILKQKLPLVIKASGLTFGKGVIIPKNYKEAMMAVDNILKKKIFGQAGDKIIIEEYLEGPEISIHAFSDGKSFVLFPPAQDHKRAYDNDEGPNTGGMGTIAPVPWVTERLMREIGDRIVKPAFGGLSKRGRKFIGVLFPGIIITADGPKVLEYNARFGDPETQSYMRLLKTDLLDIFLACTKGNLEDIQVEWKNQAACCVVMASGGYPGKYKTGIKIEGLSSAEKEKKTILFYAGTTQKGNRYFTNGGRVLGVTAIGKNLENSLMSAYKAVRKIKFDGMQFRKDIGEKSIS